VRQQGHHIGAEAEAVQVLQIFPRAVPIHFVSGGTQHRFGNVLDPRIAINNGIGAVFTLGTKGQTKAAVGNHHRGSAVTHGFRQARRNFQLQIIVGVNIEQAGHGPVAGHR
jgi:hypothetical protein